jgi:phage major head subunit gpT-like protein
MYKHVTYAKGFQLEKEMVDDEQYAIINKLPKALARAARATLEELGAGVMNGAFSNDATAFQKPYNNEALVGTHTRLDGGTTTNYIGKIALTEDNLEIALKLAHEQVDERGLKIQMNPDTLVIPRSLEYVAARINGSTLSTVAGGTGDGFAKNDINVLKGRFKIIVLDYLEPFTETVEGTTTTTKPWFLMDSQIHQLNWFWREKLSFKNETDFDTDVAKYKGRMRFSYGWSDHRGILGSKGGV